MADIGPYLLALLTAGVSAAAGYISSSLRTRSSARTAARLVHAELLQNSASVHYYRRTHHLHVPSVRRTAWDANSEALARLRGPDAFTAISESYEALEGIAIIAHAGDESVPPELQTLLEHAIDQLVRGVEICAGEAGLSEAIIHEEVRALGHSEERPARDTARPRPEISLEILTIGALVQDRPRAAAPTGANAAVGSAQPERAQHAWPDRPVRGRPRRLILDVRHGTDLGAALVVRREGDPDSGDPAADEAYDALGVAYDFFYGVFGLDSFDGEGAEMRGVVHYGTNYQNLFWDGARVVYGDGDDQLFRRFTFALDATARDVTLAALQKIRPLEFRDQPGALLTSIADVFGVVIKQFRQEQSVAEADWLLGDAMFHPRPGIRGLRSLAQPGSAYDDNILGRDQQPAHMNDYVRTEDDNGGVHLNCGIPNHAFYLVATALGGNAWETAARIWFDAVHDPKLTDRSGFRAFAAATIRAAGEHAGDVRAAWREVGVSPRTETR